MTSMWGERAFEMRDGPGKLFFKRSRKQEQVEKLMYAIRGAESLRGRMTFRS
jgi:hypothetical protein